MKIKILKDEKNELLGRREVWFETEHKGSATPSKRELAETLAAKLNAKMDLMVIRHYRTYFGKHIAKGLCLVYASPEAMVAAESRKHVLEKKRIGVLPSKEEEKPAEKGEDKPAEKGEDRPAEKEGGKPAEQEETKKQAGEGESNEAQAEQKE